MRSVAIAISVLSASAAVAQEAPTGWQVGAFGTFGPSPYVGEDSNNIALPFVSYRTEGFSLGIDGARYSVTDATNSGLDLLLVPRFPAYDDDTPALAGLERDVTLDFGAALQTSVTPSLGISVTALQELTGEHDGQELDFRLSHRAGNLPLTFYAGATWQSAGLTEYLYGVRPAEAAAGRPTYAPGAAVTPYIGVSTALPVGDRAVILGSIEARQFGDAISDSPIVEDAGSTRATLGVAFQF